VIRQEFQDYLERQLQRLPGGPAIAFLYHDVEGMSYREVSELLSISEAAARRWVRLARSRLAEALARDGWVNVPRPASLFRLPSTSGGAWRSAPGNGPSADGQNPPPVNVGGALLAAPSTPRAEGEGEPSPSFTSLKRGPEGVRSEKGTLSLGRRAGSGREAPQSSRR
jgi:hypothetical protein